MLKVWRDRYKEKEEQIRKANAKEAEEFEKIRKEEEEKLAADLARYDTDYMDEDQHQEEFKEDTEAKAEEPESEAAAPEAEAGAGEESDPKEEK
jgi:cell division protease FtsH